LIGEFQCDKVDVIEFRFWRCVWMQTFVSDKEVYVTDAKWAGIRVLCIGVFPWSQKKEEAQEKHVGYSG